MAFQSLYELFFQSSELPFLYTIHPFLSIAFKMFPQSFSFFSSKLSYVIKIRLTMAFQSLNRLFFQSSELPFLRTVPPFLSIAFKMFLWSSFFFLVNFLIS